MGWAPITNVELEYYPSENGRWTWLAEYECPWHVIDSKHQYLQCLNLQFEGRRYFKRASYHSGHYLSAYVGANYYDICFDRKAGHGYQGEGFGGGLGYGYVMPLGKKPDTKWKLELFVKGGFYMSCHSTTRTMQARRIPASTTTTGTIHPDSLSSVTWYSAGSVLPVWV